MRCILTVNFSPWSRYSGGGQRSTHNLASALARRGHEVTVVYTKPPWERVQLPAALPYAVRWAALPAVRSRSGAWLRPATPWFVAREVAALAAPGCVVHGNGEEAALVPRVRDSGQRFGFVMTPRYPAIPTLAKRFLLGRALAGADVVCPTSCFAADLVAHEFRLRAARVRVIPNGVSEEFLRAGVAAEREDFAIYFGRLAEEKGVHVLLDAIAQAGPTPRSYVFAGRGPELERLRARAKRLGISDRVRFETWLDAPALAALVRRAKFAVLPSLEESYGNTMAESLAVGVPVVSTTAGSIPEIVEDGRSGVLVRPGNASELATAMRRMAADAEWRARLTERGRERIASWDDVAGQFEEVYRNVGMDG